jgi:hypothetical protein
LLREPRQARRSGRSTGHASQRTGTQAAMSVQFRRRNYGIV